ncbi:unnamed protein product [Arabis nemorensis]|uniref:Uncharacterized protein n=1 Tax=Arabis nemorensis TaxID=586526 RepID=A0A565BUC8_9BRAS|nr:unnamed protein product [Arabis nemorensis]
MKEKKHPHLISQCGWSNRFEKLIKFVYLSQDLVRPVIRVQLEESGALREQIRAVVMEIESATRLIQANLLSNCRNGFLEVIDKAKEKINDVNKFYGRLAEILRECPGQILQVPWGLEK